MKLLCNKRESISFITKWRFVCSAVLTATLCSTGFSDQTWIGTNTTDAAYRSGNVGIGVTSMGSILARCIIRGIGTSTAAALSVVNSSSASLLYVEDDGYVGIGTSSPGTNKLKVNGSVSIGFTGTDNAPSNGLSVYGQVGIGGVNPGSTGSKVVIRGSGTGTLAALSVINNSSASCLWVQDNGCVGIGTSSPGSYKLSVNGNTNINGQLSATSVKINNWTLEAPDYVFDKNYKLPDLKIVEKKIKQHKHLPEVPSAAEMKKNGVDLTAMNMALLKKVEELTLYVIEQNKKIEILEVKIADKK